jgi:elongation factor 1-beta
LKEDLNMGSVVVTYKIFPTDIVENFDDMKKKIEGSLPESSSVGGYGEEPVAFGLKALLVQVRFPEEKTGLVDEFEKKLESVEGISQVQTMMVRRTSR